MSLFSKIVFLFFAFASCLWGQSNTVAENTYAEKTYAEKTFSEEIFSEKTFSEKTYAEKEFAEEIIASSGLNIKESQVIILKKENIEDYFKGKYDIDWGHVASRFAIGTSVIVLTGTITIVAGTSGVLGTVAFAAFKGAVEGAVAGAAIGAALGGLEGYFEDGNFSSVEKNMVESAADGYMWGAIIGAVTGGARGVKDAKLKKMDAFKECGIGNSCTEVPSSQVVKAKNFDPVKGCNIGAKNQCVKNYRYAGKRFKFEKGTLQDSKYPQGVFFKANGYPDFSQYAKATVKFDKPSVEGVKKGLCLSGNEKADFALANKTMGYSYTPPGYTWHHVEDMQTMILVPQDVHSVVYGGVAHDGGAALIRSLLEKFGQNIK